MRRRTTLVLLVLVLLAGSSYYVLDVRGRETREAARLAEQRVLDFDPGTVTEITVDKRGERVVVRAEQGRWRIVSPEAGAADATTVDGLLAFVRRLEKVRTLDGADDLGELGLVDPAVRLGLGLRDGQRLTLLLAGPNPAGTGVYAKLDGAPLIFLAPAELARELAKTPYLEQLRDKRILAVEPGRVRRLEIERAGVRIALQRTDERRWRVERPFAGPGDDGIIRDLLWKIGAARAHATVRSAAPPREYGLDRPHARARIVDDAGTTHTIALVLNEANSRELYVTVEGSGMIHVTDGQLLNDLTIDPDALRDRQLLAHDGRDVERITVRYPTETLVLERAVDRWRVTRPVEGEPVPNLIDNLLEVLPNIRYTTVAASAPGDLRAYGLDRPELAVTVGLQGGRELPTLSVGREQGGLRFVMVTGNQAVYKVDSRLIRVFPDHPADAKRYPLPEQLKRRFDRQNVN
jgi:hypothetical protein